MIRRIKYYIDLLHLFFPYTNSKDIKKIKKIVKVVEDANNRYWLNK